MNYLELAQIDLSQVDKNVIYSFLNDLQQENKLSERSLNRKCSANRRFFDYLLQNKVVVYNPFKQIKHFKEPKTLPDFMTFEDVKQFLNSIDESTALGVRNRVLFELMYACGLRLSEILGLTISDVDFRERTLLIRG